MNGHYRFILINKHDAMQCKSSLNNILGSVSPSAYLMLTYIELY